MNRLAFAAVLVFLPALAVAAFDPALLDQVGRGYAGVQPGLETYRVNLETSKFSEMLEKMTAGIPPDLPRPAQPSLVQYWSRDAGASVVRGEGEVFPYMQEMIRRFSTDFAVDLRTFFLPAGQSGRRAGLLGRATVETRESAGESGRTLSVHIHFPAPTDLDGAFYGEGLALPQKGVKALVIDLDPEQKTLRRLEITTGNDRTLTVQVRHRAVEGGHLPEEIRIGSQDESVAGRFVTTFGEVQGYWLPLQQVRSLLQAGKEETLVVKFVGYRLNVPLPADILRELQHP